MAKKIGLTWILNMFITVGRLLWNAITLFSYVFKGIAVIFKTVWEILKPVYEVFKSVWDVIYSFYVKYIKPVLDWLEGKITWILDLIDSVYNTLLGRIVQLYNETFGEYEKLRDRIDDLTGKISRVVGVFDEKLAAAILDAKNDIFDYLDQYTRDIRDWAVEKIRENYISIRSDFYEYKGAIDIILHPVKEFVDAMKELIPPTIEKPALLSRDTMYNSGNKYGQDLMDGYFDATTPPLTPELTRIRPVREEVEWLTRHMNYIALGPLSPWVDLHKRVGEAIIEIATGEDVVPKTEVEMPVPKEGEE